MTAALLKTIPICGRCDEPHGRVGQRLCGRCNAANMRLWRTKQRDELLRLRALDQQLNGNASS